MPRGAPRVSCGNCRETTTPEHAAEEWVDEDLELVRCPECRCPACGRGYRLIRELPPGHEDAPGWGIVHDYEIYTEDGERIREFSDYCIVKEEPADRAPKLGGAA